MNPDASNIAYQASIINAVSEVFENKQNNLEYNKAVENAFKKANINSELDPYTASVRMSYKFDEIVEECVKAYGASKLKKKQSDLEEEFAQQPDLTQTQAAIAIADHFETNKPLEGEFIHHNPFSDTGKEVKEFNRGLFDMEGDKKPLFSKENLLFIAKHSALFGLSVSTGGMAAMYGPLYYAGFKMLSSAGIKAIQSTGLMDKMVTAVANRMLPLVNTLKAMPIIEKNPRLTTYAGALAVGAAVLAGSLIGLDAEDTLAATNDFKDQLSTVDLKTMVNESVETLNTSETEIVSGVSEALASAEPATSEISTSFTDLASQHEGYAEQISNSYSEKTPDLTSPAIEPEIGESESIALGEGEMAAKDEPTTPSTNADKVTTSIDKEVDDIALVKPDIQETAVPTETEGVSDAPEQTQSFFNNLDEQLNNYMKELGSSLDDSHSDISVSEIPTETCEITVENIADVAEFNTTEMPSHNGGLWGVLDDQLENSGIRFETEQEKNAAIVELINAVAEQNPSIENIHDIKAGQAINLPTLDSMDMVEAVTENVDLEHNVLAEHVNPYKVPSATDLLNNNDDISALTLDQITTSPVFSDFKSPEVPEMGSKALAEMNLVDMTFGSEKEKAFAVDSIAKALDETMSNNGGQAVIFDNLNQDHVDYIIENGGIENYELKEPTLSVDSELELATKTAPKMKF